MLSEMIFPGELIYDMICIFYFKSLSKLFSDIYSIVLKALNVIGSIHGLNQLPFELRPPQVSLLVQSISQGAVYETMFLLVFLYKLYNQQNDKVTDKKTQYSHVRHHQDNLPSTDDESKSNMNSNSRLLNHKNDQRINDDGKNTQKGTKLRSAFMLASKKVAEQNAEIKNAES